MEKASFKQPCHVFVVEKMGVSSRLPFISNRLMKPLPQSQSWVQQTGPTLCKRLSVSKKTSLQANISPPKNRISY